MVDTCRSHTVDKVTFGRAGLEAELSLLVRMMASKLGEPHLFLVIQRLIESNTKKTKERQET